MLAILILVFVSFCGAAEEPPGGYYTTRYDHLDVENILNQKRLVNYYAACLLDKGPCTPQGTEFKSILPEAIKTNCLRCTEKQRVVTLRSIKRLKKEYPDVWAKLQNAWDPTGEYVKRLEGSVNRPIPIKPVTAKTTTATEISDNVLPLGNRFDDTGLTPNQPEVVTKSTTIASVDFTRVTESPRIGYPKTEAPRAETPRTEAPIDASSTTMKILITTLNPRPTITNKRVDVSKSTTKRIYVKTTRPFNSIVPNLVIPSPKAIIDSVIMTAGAVLNSVTNTVTNTVVTVFKG